jgi:hypothetical protein
MDEMQIIKKVLTRHLEPFMNAANAIDKTGTSAFGYDCAVVRAGILAGMLVEDAPDEAGNLEPGETQRWAKALAELAIGTLHVDPT